MHSEGLNYFMLTNQSMPIFAEKLVFFTKQYLGLVMLFFAAHVSSSSIAKFFCHLDGVHHDFCCGVGL
ncbi:MAG: hypothetical protein B9S37_03795 [Verrucomicrobiia bacterium Tous-C3TDCM]|nr:MAG: hypothetical protein B9S37_03795 [Verrucomicrobiae bacterium Tous-C3TDCM]